MNNESNSGLLAFTTVITIFALVVAALVVMKRVSPSAHPVSASQNYPWGSPSYDPTLLDAMWQMSHR